MLVTAGGKSYYNFNTWLNSVPLLTIKCTKCLGVIIHDKFSWVDHINMFRYKF